MCQIKTNNMEPAAGGETWGGSSRFPRETEIQSVISISQRQPWEKAQPAPPAWPETANQIRDYENRDWKHSLWEEARWRECYEIYEYYLQSHRKACIQSVKTNLCILINCTISYTNTRNQIKLQYQNLLCTVMYVNKEECEGNMITSMCGMGIVVSMDLSCPLVLFWSHIKVIGSQSPGTLPRLFSCLPLHFSSSPAPWQARECGGAECGPPALITGHHVNLKGLSPLLNLWMTS